MAVDIFQIELGFDQCYVLKSEGVIAVDAGAPNKGRNFARGLERASIHPQDVQLVVITHGHWDHVGSAGELKAITGAQLAMHQREVHWLEQPLHRCPLESHSGGAYLSAYTRSSCHSSTFHRPKSMWPSAMTAFRSLTMEYPVGFSTLPVIAPDL